MVIQNRNRKLIQKYNYKNNIWRIYGELEGEYKEYYEDGHLKIICNFKNGKFEGEYKEYHKNGQLMRIYNYKNGKKEREYKEYHKNE